ncbi:hypothetical protein AEA42_21650, partial [Shewanella sp. Sh95]
MLLHSDEQTISIAVVNTPPAELMEALRFATQKRIDIECWSQEQMDKRLQAQEKQAQLAQNDGPENIAERVNQILEQALRQRASDIHIKKKKKWTTTTVKISWLTIASHVMTCDCLKSRA